VAKVALVKIFPGLNFGVAQLSASLERAGHRSLVVYFKKYSLVPDEEVGPKYLTTELNAGIIIAGRAKRVNLNAFTPITPRENELLIQVLREFDPDLIGFSLHTDCMREGAEVTTLIRKFFDVPIVWGGVGPTIQPERSLAYADIVCLGEGEEALVELANGLDAGTDIAHINSLWVKQGDEVVKNPGRPLVDLNAIPAPDFDVHRTILINDDQLFRDVYAPAIQGGRQYMIMTQRGCPYSCSFCVESVYQDRFGKKEHLRRRTVDAVIDELVQAKEKHDMKVVLFYDDVFTVNPKWLKEFAPRYKKEVGLPFWCYTYPRSTRKEELVMLKDAGLASVTVGVQSGSEEVLSSYNRPVPSTMAIRAARDIVDVGLHGIFELMTMSEFETEETCWETFEFLMEFPQEMHMAGLFPMIKYPTYGYTERVASEQRSMKLSEHDYLFFHKIYLLTRTALPRRVVRSLAQSRIVRRFPQVLDPLLPKDLPFFQIPEYAVDLPGGGSAAHAGLASPEIAFTTPHPPH